MFAGFFYTLRRRKVPVSLTEWMTLMEALAKGCITNLDEFYFLARAILVKSEAYYDHYDVAFQEYFRGIETSTDSVEPILKWLGDPMSRIGFTEEEEALFDSTDFKKQLKEIGKTLRGQTRKRQGRHYGIGTGDMQGFGRRGHEYAGTRIGGESGGMHAMQLAQERRFLNYRNDLTLSTREIEVTLKRLRRLNRTGPEDELDLERSVDATARNAGEIELLWQPSRKNAVKLLLLMDAGRSMEPFVLLCSQLFSAAHSSSHFKDLRYYYFHNCIYDNLYQDMERQETIGTNHLLRLVESDYKVLLVGDARMAVSELLYTNGAISYHERSKIPGGVAQS